jgi:ketosteroid isomerase-like protein
LLAPALQSISAEPTESERQISSVREQWEKAWNAKDQKTLFALYDKDAVLVPPTGERITGRDNIENYFQPLIKESSNLTTANHKTEESKGLMHESGDFEHTVTRPASVKIGSDSSIKMGAGSSMKLGTISRHVHGKYRMTLKRASEGKWFIVEHGWNEVPDAPAK